MIPLQDDETKPHKAILFIRAEVREADERGECAARAVYTINEFILALSGHDRAITIRRLNEVLAELKEKCT